MKRIAIPAVPIGLIVAGMLLDRHDPAAILAARGTARWWIAVPVLLHLPQILALAIGWSVPIERDARPGVVRSFAWRRVEEAVDALRPIAQISGGAVRVRLSVRAGADATAATAIGLADDATEMAAQILSTLVGLVVRVVSPHRAGAGWIALPLATALIALGAALIAASRSGWRG